MYSRITLSSLPTADTKYPHAQKCWPLCRLGKVTRACSSKVTQASDQAIPLGDPNDWGAGGVSPQRCAPPLGAPLVMTAEGRPDGGLGASPREGLSRGEDVDAQVGDPRDVSASLACWLVGEGDLECEEGRARRGGPGIPTGFGGLGVSVL